MIQGRGGHRDQAVPATAIEVCAEVSADWSGNVGSFPAGLIHLFGIGVATVFGTEAVAHQYKKKLPMSWAKPPKGTI